MLKKYIQHFEVIKKLKTILLSNLSYEHHYGGVENSIKFLAQEYESLGYQVIILSGSFNKKRFSSVNSSSRIKQYNFRFKIFENSILNVIFSPFYIFDLMWSIYQIKSRYNVVHSVCRNQFVCFFINLFLSNNNVYLAPGFSHRQSSNENMGEYSRLRNIKKYIHSYFDFKAVTKSSSLFIFSENMKEQANELVKLYTSKEIQQKVTITKPGVDKKVYFPLESCVKKQLKEKLGFPNDSKILLCVGRCVKAKGFDIAIKSMIGVSDPNLKLVIIGDGLEFERYLNLIEDNGLQSNVIMIGSSDVVHEYYKVADYFIMSSIYEPLGQTILEAIASGLPIVAFDSASVLTATEELLGKDGAIYVEEPNELFLKKCIVNLPSVGDVEYEEFKCKSLSISKEFDWAKLATTLIS